MREEQFFIMLLYFILGCLFVLICIPVIEDLLSIFSAWVEYIVYLFALKVYKIKQQLLIEEE